MIIFVVSLVGLFMMPLAVACTSSSDAATEPLPTKETLDARTIQCRVYYDLGMRRSFDIMDGKLSFADVVKSSDPDPVKDAVAATGILLFERNLVDDDATREAMIRNAIEDWVTECVENIESGHY